MDVIDRGPPILIIESDFGAELKGRDNNSNCQVTRRDTHSVRDCYNGEGTHESSAVTHSITNGT